MRLDPIIVLHQIDALKAAFPDIWEDEDEKLLQDCLQAETSVFEFLSIIETRRRDASAMAGAVEQRMVDLQARQARFERREKAMRELAFKIMQAAELPKVELPEATLSIRKGTPKVVITNEEWLSDILCKFKRSPNLPKIKECLQNGDTVPGAYLSNGEPTITIRTK